MLSLSSMSLKPLPLVFFLTLMTAVVFLQTARAQQDSAAAPELAFEETQEDAQEDTDEQGAEESEIDEESDARFVPSEEISQDLGVAFPVDI